MSPPQPTLFYDLGSPYAYLAAERAASVLGVAPRLEPVLVGGIFVLRGHGSWSQTDERPNRVAEVEARARHYGLPPLVWPPGWPNNTLQAMRAAVWAERLGAGQAFARAAFRRAFAASADLSQLDVLLDVAVSVGLPAEQLSAAIAAPAIKEALRAATTRAWQRGVVGVPCIGVGERILYGDDQLEAAAKLLADDPLPRTPQTGFDPL
jgi:2-hydroxychromene-2-carboxylate isomerase